MTTLEDLITRRFECVTTFEDGGISTVEFLEASEGVVKLFDILGSTAFYPKVRAKYSSDPVAFDTLQKIIIAEAVTKNRTATQGLLWLKRGLEMTALGLKRNLDNKDEALSDSFTKAYEATLRQYHNFIVKNMFSVAMYACPSRETFYEKIGGNNDRVHDGLLKWVEALQSLLNELNIFYASESYDKGL
ncbi:hypothetical protein LPJ59_002175 [Coemansia sp. RSA 2399]|nr:hypothetical protein LPJ59_002175 [Coemansia sp. RSA 2399]KAJ1905574.1 hypothetical protein LPJ81_001852 [Coemansia sp. IMI 209127]